MELQELVERINRWKLRKTGELPEGELSDFSATSAAVGVMTENIIDDSFSDIGNTEDELPAADESDFARGYDANDAYADSQDDALNAAFDTDISGDNDILSDNSLDADEDANANSLSFEDNDQDNDDNALHGMFMEKGDDELETVALQQQVPAVPVPPVAVTPSRSSNSPEVPSMPRERSEENTQEVESLDIVDEDK